MVLTLAFVGVLAFLVWTLLAPSTVGEVLQRNIPRESRTPEGNSSQFATIVIFFVGIGLFYQIGREWPPKTSPHLNMFAFGSSIAGFVFLLVTGAFACLRPMQWMRLFNVRLRKIPDEQIDLSSRQRAAIVAKVFGVIFLLAAAYVIHQVGVSN
jgi:hypothetical protein